MIPVLASSGGFFLDQENTSMTTYELRATTSALTSLHQCFAPLFGRKEARAQSLVYLNGLRLSHERKSAEPMALVFEQPDDDGIGQNQVLGLQRFLSKSPWDYRGGQREIQAVFAEKLVPSTTSWPIGTVGAFDRSGFPQKGRESLGLQRQYCGRLGKKDNCQVGVFLVGVTPAGLLLDGSSMVPAQSLGGRSPASQESSHTREYPFSDGVEDRDRSVRPDPSGGQSPLRRGNRGRNLWPQWNVPERPGFVKWHEPRHRSDEH
jgi:hypothetical protein